MKSTIPRSAVLAFSLGVLVALPVLLGQPSVANGSVFGTSIDASDLIGSRSSSPTGGILATDGWSGGNFVLSWDISYDALNRPLDPWSYSYTINITNSPGDQLKGLSHWILQVTTRDTIGDFSSFSSPPDGADPDTYSATFVGNPPTPGGAQPNMPNSIFGLKFTPTTDAEKTSFTVSFFSDKDPVWGDFYAKDGTDQHGTVQVTAWNAGLATPSSDNTNDFIARPDGGSNPPFPPEPGPTPAPEPMSLLVWGGLAALGALMAYRRRAEK